MDGLMMHEGPINRTSGGPPEKPSSNAGPVFFTLMSGFGLFLIICQMSIVSIESPKDSSQYHYLVNANTSKFMHGLEDESVRPHSDSCIGPFLTVADGGRLGNLMSQYATLYASSKRFHVKAVISAKMAGKLDQIFPYLSIRPLLPSCKLNWTKTNIRNLGSHSFTNGENVLIDGYPSEVPMFDFYRKLLSLTDFKMNSGVEEDAKRFLQKVAKDTGAQVFVGVHVRRTDYSVWLKKMVNGRLLSKQYYSKAMSIFRDKYKDYLVAFVVASDDKKWCRSMLSKEPGFVLTDQTNSRELDLAILAQTNESIISFGTFGFWSAYLRPTGDVIIADGHSQRKTLLNQQISTMLPFWKFLRDPCFQYSKTGRPVLTKECAKKRHEYGIFEN